MEDFSNKLALAIEMRKKHLEKEKLPKLKELFRLFHTSFTNIYNVLLRKGLVTEDPYKNDLKISDVGAPTGSPFMESEKSEQMSIRLSHYESQLDFLHNYYQFSVDFLTIKRIKGIIELINYIQWIKLSENSTNIYTRVTAELVNKIKKGTDTLSANIINDAQNQLLKLSKETQQTLKEVTSLQREIYKLEVRDRILAKLKLDSFSPGDKIEEGFKQIKKLFPQEMAGYSFYPELIRELIYLFEN